MNLLIGNYLLLLLISPPVLIDSNYNHLRITHSYSLPVRAPGSASLLIPLMIKSVKRLLLIAIRVALAAGFS